MHMVKTFATDWCHLFSVEAGRVACGRGSWSLRGGSAEAAHPVLTVAHYGQHLISLHNIATEQTLDVTLIVNK